MVVRKSVLRRRAEHGPGSVVEEEKPRNRDRTPLGQLVHFLGFGRARGNSGALSEIPMADLLSPRASTGPSSDRLIGLLDLAFLGRASAGEIDRELDAQPCGESNWVAAHFTDDLFLAELVAGCMSTRIGSSGTPEHLHFVERVLTMIPADLETVRYRQAILRELEESRISSRRLTNSSGGSVISSPFCERRATTPASSHSVFVSTCCAPFEMS